MKMRVRADYDRWVVGSALRNARETLWALDELCCDTNRPARLNDVVLAEFLDPTVEPASSPVNWVERLYPGRNGDEVVLRREPFKEEILIGVVGNRYAPPYLVGGLENPNTGKPNGEIVGGTIAESLFGANCLGFVNHVRADVPRFRVRVTGVLLDPDDQPLTLRNFREKLSGLGSEGYSRPRRIVVAGFSTDAGKTICARALVRELGSRGFRVTAEKKSGTACCRDWLSYWSDPTPDGFVGGEAGITFEPRQHPGRDFVDALGVASDVSIDTAAFVRESIAFTRAFERLRPADFHIIELADNLAHRSNWALLAERSFVDELSLLVYCPYPSPESVAHSLAFIRSELGMQRTPLILSGPLANEDAHRVVREEVLRRLAVPIARCAVNLAGTWVSEGSSLADAALGMLGRRSTGG